MSDSRCPGQDMRYWKPEDIFSSPCPFCGAQVEFWKDEPVSVCPTCRKEACNPRLMPGCGDHCAKRGQCAAHPPRAE
jgi:hypothetical protein